ncbi:MAG: hypothetical protein KAH72_07015 [Flavobacteriaceae bacterium]|nr:hypothetical protein [Flavobacteriaceae bacterium]
MKKVGIWLDQKEANVITLFENTQQQKIIYSDIETRERFEGETKQYGRFGEQYLNYEKGQQKRIKDLTNRYLNKIIQELNNADEIMIFGPAQTKIKLEKLIQGNPNLLSKLKDVQVSDNMTENQKVAYVKKYFK